VDSVASRVKALLFERASTGIPAVDEAARRLGTSGRSLQRALRAEGTSYAALSDEVRKELALAHLRQRDRTLSEIALLVGFQEVAAFTRAFRRWTGVLPSAFRRGLLDAPG
jgi:AraC-like DNA-binding protein